MGTLVLCPTRGRHHNAVDLLTSFEETAALESTQLVCVVDEDDPELDSYLQELPSQNVEINESIGSMVLALNAAATLHATIGVYDYIGFVGDDHRFRTKGWDETFEKVLRDSGGGFIYGNDLYQGVNLPTHVVMNASIVLALGWMAPPFLKHLYVDDCWKVMGSSVNRLFYAPEVVIEHLHPFAGKAEMDAGYARVNGPEMVEHDRTEFEKWLKGSAQSDIAKVRGILAL